MLIKEFCLPRVVRASTAVLFVVGFISDTFAEINWQPCEGVADSQFQCATVDVPLNHQQHIGYSSEQGSGMGAVSIALARLPASDGVNKKGTLFLNPGGPGGSGVDFLLVAGHYLFTEAVRQNYDLVGFDPRGIGRSDELRCFEDPSEFTPLAEAPVFPVTQEEVKQWEKLDQYISSLCDSRAGELVNHMSTADVARDMDLLRQAVGDEKLYFVGYSYGSYLGVTYANLFPENVGAMVLDGVLDPIAWSTGRGWQSYFLPFTTRLRSAEGSQDTLHEFFRTCDEGGMEVCALAHYAESRFTNVAERIREKPIIVIADDGSEIVIDYATFVAIMRRALVIPESWPDFASAVASVEEDLGSSEIAKRYYDMLRSLGLEDDQSDMSVEQPIVGWAGVSCSDSDNPYLYENWAWAAELSDAVYKYFGAYWTWGSSICHSWPGSKESRYAGGFKVKTDTPVLVVNTLFDPSTPYHGAKIVERLLKDSRLLTVNGWGHTSLFISDCADSIVADYLLRSDLPEKGVSCDPNVTPFGASLPAGHSGHRVRPFAMTRDREKERELRRKVLKDMFPYRLR